MHPHWPEVLLIEIPRLKNSEAVGESPSRAGDGSIRLPLGDARQAIGYGPVGVDRV